MVVIIHIMYLHILGFELFSCENFAIDLKRVEVTGAAGTPSNRVFEDINKNYDKKTGIFSFKIPYQTVDGTWPRLEFDVCLYYVGY